MRDHLERALIMGVRQGLSASLTRLIAREGMGVGTRRTDGGETGAPWSPRPVQ
jgi:hypothetical protein